MNYLLFNNKTFISDSGNVRLIDKDNDLKDILRSVEQANLCVVDVDVMIAAAVEFPLEKKDSILVRKFKELYQHDTYIIQDERIDNNLFQVIGFKEQKVREVYSLIPPGRVESFIPYGIALRNTLMNEGIDLNQTVVFVDEGQSERLLTVFDGLMFSRTRVIAKNGEDILPEIKRSQIDFFKKTEEYLNKKSTDFAIVVNNQALAAEILKNQEKLQVEYLNVTYPALEGLKEINTSIKYRLPEEIVQKRREIELRNNINTAVLSIGLVLVGLFYFLFNKIELEVINNQCRLSQKANDRLNEQLGILDKATYRQDLMVHKYLNYGVMYLLMLEIVPESYRIDSFKFFKTDKWNLEADLFADDDGLFEVIPRIKILKNAEIKDIFVNNQPGKHLKIIL